MKIYVATGNKDKVSEIEDILDLKLEFADFEVDEVQSMDLEYVARKKAERAYEVLKKPVIVDDVGVFVKAWNGFPGPFAKFFLKDLGNKKLLEFLKKEKDRSVEVKCAVAFHDGRDIKVFTGTVKGTISKKELGKDGWGFDPVIIPDGETKTYAQMGFKKKNMLSHRKKALDKLKKFLDSQNIKKDI